MTTLRPRDPFRKSSIQIEQSELSSDDTDLKRRIDRIASNYHRLNQKLTEIETLLVEDERLQEIQNSLGSAGFGEPPQPTRKKRKWPTLIQSSTRKKNLARILDNSDTTVSDSAKMGTNRSKQKGNKTTTKHSAKIHPKKPR